MTNRQRKRRPPAELVLAMVALFAAITGSAAALPGTNRVTSDDIKNGQVRTADLARGAVGPSDLLGKPLPPAAAARGSSARQTGLEQSKVISSVQASSTLFNGLTLVRSQLINRNGISTTTNGAVSFDKIVNGTVSPKKKWSGASSGAFPGGSIGAATGTPIPYGQLTDIAFSTKTIDAGGMVSPDGTRLCAPYPGAYDIKVQIIWGENPHGTRTLLLIRDDLKELGASSVNAVTSNRTYQSIFTLQALEQGECVRVAVIQTAFSPATGFHEVPVLALGASSPGLAATYVGPATRAAGH